MAKIIEFRLPDRTAGGYVGFETPVKREPDPPKRPSKEPIVISVMPEKAFPIGHQDFRPVLQRDGLILRGWSRWEEVAYDGPRYVVHWVSVCNGRLYITHFLTGAELETAKPQRQGRYLLDRVCWNDHVEADYIYFPAPERLSPAERPGFIQRLKAAGVTVDFSFHYSMDRIKKIQFAEQYLESLKNMQEEGQV
jgi:hypothetical protein